MKVIRLRWFRMSVKGVRSLVPEYGWMVASIALLLGCVASPASAQIALPPLPEPPPASSYQSPAPVLNCADGSCMRPTLMRHQTACHFSAPAYGADGPIAQVRFPRLRNAAERCASMLRRCGPRRCR